MAEEAEVWQEAAERDRAMCSSLYSSGFFEGAAFHAQQSAEKMLKSLLTSRNAWSRTHSCTEMLSIVRHEGLAVDDSLFRDSRLVDRAYVDARYPRKLGSQRG